MFHVALDRAALARSVPAFADDDDFLPGLLDPVLDLQQFDLQFAFVMLVDGPADFGFVRITSRPKQLPDHLGAMAHPTEEVRRGRGVNPLRFLCGLLLYALQPGLGLGPGIVFRHR